MNKNNEFSSGMMCRLFGFANASLSVVNVHCDKFNLRNSRPEFYG